MTYQFERSDRRRFLETDNEPTYRSVAGVCNMVFTVAMILFTANFPYLRGSDADADALWMSAVSQISRSRSICFPKQAKTMPKDVKLSFDDAGLHVTVGKEKESIGWKKLRVANEPGMMIVFSDARHGYMLTNRILGAQKEPFFAFAKERIAETN